MIAEKAEECPQCGGALSQHGYDMQQCPCGWNAMLRPTPAACEEAKHLIASVAGGDWYTLALDLDTFVWEQNQKLRLVEREKVAALMMRLSIATGHGDTIDNLLSELEAAVVEKDAQIAAARSWLGREG